MTLSYTSDDLFNLKDMFITYMATQDTLEARNLINATIQKVEVDNDKVAIRFYNGISMSHETAKLFMD